MTRLLLSLMTYVVLTTPPADGSDPTLSRLQPGATGISWEDLGPMDELFPELFTAVGPGQ